MATEHDGKDGIFKAIVVDDKVVGNIAVEQNSDVRCKDSEIGYFLLTDNWSKGIMTEAVKQICKLAFDKLDIVRISGTVYLPNTASQRVLEKMVLKVKVCGKMLFTKMASFMTCVYMAN